MSIEHTELQASYFARKFQEELTLLSVSNTFKDAKEEWAYAGSDNGGDYLEQVIEKFDVEIPEHEDFCICTHEIENNHYLRRKSDNHMIVIGSSCKKRYMPDDCNSKLCFRCEKPHKNRKDGYCNECRVVKSKEPKTVLNFGKYKGESFKSIWENNPDYCIWILLHSNCKQQDFTNWIMGLHPRKSFDHLIVTFGKHKGKSFSYIYENERGYCEWITSKDESDRVSNMNTLRYYIDDRDMNP